MLVDSLQCKYSGCVRRQQHVDSAVQRQAHCTYVCLPANIAALDCSLKRHIAVVLMCVLWPACFQRRTALVMCASYIVQQQSPDRSSIFSVVSGGSQTNMWVMVSGIA